MFCSIYKHCKFVTFTTVKETGTKPLKNEIMKNLTFENRAKKQGLRKNTIAYTELYRLLNNEIKESRPDISTRRNVRKYTDDILFYARLMGIGVHRLNDAPKGGIAGNYCFLTKKGKRQMFTK